MSGAQRLIMRLRRSGLDATITQKGHVRIETPSGPVFTSGSPSDWRSLKNMAATLKSKGVHVDYRKLL